MLAVVTATANGISSSGVQVYLSQTLSIKEAMDSNLNNTYARVRMHAQAQTVCKKRTSKIAYGFQEKMHWINSEQPSAGFHIYFKKKKMGASIFMTKKESAGFCLFCMFPSSHPRQQHYPRGHVAAFPFSCTHLQCSPFPYRSCSTLQ